MSYRLVASLILMMLVLVAGCGRSPEDNLRRQRVKVDISNMVHPLEEFRLHCGRYPTTDEGLAALVDAPPKLRDWNGPYSEAVPVDPWGNEYLYRCPGEHNPDGYDLYSAGPDKQAGTDDDVGNW